MKTHDFWYDLPEELIAQTPLAQRDRSRLLVLNKESGAVEHKHFYDILDYLNPGDCLVMNDSRVLPARLLGHRPTGGAAEVLLLRDCGNKCWECLVKPGKKMKVGTKINISGVPAEVLSVTEEGNRMIRFDFDGDFNKKLEEIGEIPLPPYITAKDQDYSRYQTVYAEHNGSVAAPTAGRW